MWLTVCRSAPHSHARETQWKHAPRGSVGKFTSTANSCPVRTRNGADSVSLIGLMCGLALATALGPRCSPPSGAWSRRTSMYAWEVMTAFRDIEHAKASIVLRNQEVSVWLWHGLARSPGDPHVIGAHRTDLQPRESGANGRQCFGRRC